MRSGFPFEPGWEYPPSRCPSDVGGDVLRSHKGDSFSTPGTRSKRASRLNVVLELGSNEAIKEAVLAGLGVAVLSRHVVADEMRAGQLRALRISRLSLARDIFVVRDRRRALPIQANLFLQLLTPSAAPRA